MFTKNEKKAGLLALVISLPIFLAYLSLCFVIKDHFAFRVEPWVVLCNIIVNALLATTLITIVLLRLLFSKRLRIFGYLAYLMLIAFFVSNTIYFQYYSSVLSPYILSKLSYLPNLTGQIYYLGSWIDILVVVMALLGIVGMVRIVSRFKKDPISYRSRSLVLVLIGIFSFAGAKVAIIHTTQNPLGETYFHSRSEMAIIHGFSPVFAYDLSLPFLYGSAQVEWPGRVEADLDTEPSKKEKSHRYPAFKGYNIITVQVESLDYEVLFHKISGKPVMPFLQELAKESIFLKYFFAQHRGGGSSDAELSSLASLLPFDEFTGFFRGHFEQINTLPRLLAEQNYYPVAMHAYNGTFYDRTFIYPQMGFQRFDDAASFTGEASGWFSKDIAFFEQVADKVQELPQPFYLHLVTMQSHGPFNNHIPNNNRFDLSQVRGELFRNYILTINEVDQALRRFVKRLKEDGLLDKTILFIYSDHSAAHKLAFDYGAVKNGDICEDGECIHVRDRIPLIIYSQALKPEVIEKVGSHLDIAPTIMQLAGFTSAEDWIGTSLLNGKRGTTLLKNNPLTIIYNEDDHISLWAYGQEEKEKFSRLRKFYDYSAYRLFKR